MSHKLYKEGPNLVYNRCNPSHLNVNRTLKLFLIVALLTKKFSGLLIQILTCDLAGRGENNAM